MATAEQELLQLLQNQSQQQTGRPVAPEYYDMLEAVNLFQSPDLVDLS